MLKLVETNEGRVLEVTASGRLSHADYQQLEPAVERLLKRHGRINVLFEMTNFEGWDLGGFWDDVKFDLKHFADVERFAMVGEQRWEKHLTDLSRPFTAADVRYFDRDRIDEARQWVAAGVPAPGR